MRNPKRSDQERRQLFKQLERKYVHFEVRESDYSIAPADVREVEDRQRNWIKRSDLLTLHADLK